MGNILHFTAQNMGSVKIGFSARIVLFGRPEKRPFLCRPANYEVLLHSWEGIISEARQMRDVPSTSSGQEENSEARSAGNSKVGMEAEDRKSDPQSCCFVGGRKAAGQLVWL